MNRIIILLLTLLPCLSVGAQNGGYQGSFSIGYINKDWISDFGGDHYHENIFGQEGKYLHGMQVMFGCSFCMPVGLGVHTGLGYEWCMSYSDEIKKMGFDRFNEHSLYLPLHATWRIPLAKDVSISPYSGLGFNWKIKANMKSGSYSGLLDWIHDDEEGRYYYHRWDDDYMKVRYGRDGWPKALNTQLEFGVNIRVKSVVVGVTYSKGLTDHEFYRKDHVKTRQDKLAITIGAYLDGDD